MFLAMTERLRAGRAAGRRAPAPPRPARRSKASATIRQLRRSSAPTRRAAPPASRDRCCRRSTLASSQPTPRLVRASSANARQGDRRTPSAGPAEYQHDEAGREDRRGIRAADRPTNRPARRAPGGSRPAWRRRTRQPAKSRSESRRCGAQWSAPGRGEIATRTPPASAAATMASRANAIRRRGGSGISKARPMAATANAKVTPPTQTELSKPAAATSPNTITRRGLRSVANRASRKLARTTAIAAATCCGAHEIWVSQPPKPEAQPIQVVGGVAADQPSTRSAAAEPVAASATTQIEAEPRPPIQAAKPIISASEANAVNQVRRGIGLPSARTGEHRDHGGAEMPEVIVGEAVGRADLAEERIGRRHAGAHHFVDHGDLE